MSTEFIGGTLVEEKKERSMSRQGEPLDREAGL